MALGRTSISSENQEAEGRCIQDHWSIVANVLIWQEISTQETPGCAKRCSCKRSGLECFKNFLGN